MTTSHTNPLRIAEITLPSGGRIGMTFAPGKKQASAMSGRHDRDLDIDLDAIAAWNAAAVVTLVEDHELQDLAIGGLGRAVRDRFMEWHHWPIQDYSVPDAQFEALWPARSAMLRGLLARGERVLVHCKGGLGRAGSVAARLLVEAGAASDADRAIAIVRAVRPGAIETRGQERWVAEAKPASDTPSSSEAAQRDRAMGALLGLAIGDAVGTTLEFTAKPERPQIDDMVGGGPFRLEPGQWTDDTAMALALADSLLADAALDPKDLMDRFVSWRATGSYSCTGSCFDIGNTTAQSLRTFQRTGDPLAGPEDPRQAGNGSIMRLAPVALRHWQHRPELARVASLQARTTHGAPEAIEGAAILAEILADAIAGRSLSEIVVDHGPRVRGFRSNQGRNEVEGTGYVVASLHAALWSVARTTSFRDAVLMAANLGNDADTTAAVAGQIAGAVYGLQAIPDTWLSKLAWRDRLVRTAEALWSASLGDPAPAVV